MGRAKGGLIGRHYWFPLKGKEIQSGGKGANGIEELAKGKKDTLRFSRAPEGKQTRPERGK